MKLIIETGPVGDHPPEEIEVPRHAKVLMHEHHCISVESYDGKLLYHMHGEDWTELRIVNDLEI